MAAAARYLKRRPPCVADLQAVWLWEAAGKPTERDREFWRKLKELQAACSTENVGQGEAAVRNIAQFTRCNLARRALIGNCRHH
jgi:hypothetical protein